MRFLPRHARTLALLGLTSATLIAQPALAACPQLLTNSEFTSGSTSPWTLQLNNINTSGSYYVSTDQYKALHLDVYAALSGEDVTDVELSQPISIVSGQTYRISFWIDSDAAAHSIWIKVGKRTTPWTAYGIDAARAIPAAGGNITVEFTATATDADAGFVIFLGDRDAHVVIDSVFVEHISSAACDDPGGGGNGSTTGDSSISLATTPGVTRLPPW